MNHKHYILYAEDDHDDLYMVKQAFHQFDSEIELIHVSNGLEALEELNHGHQVGKLPCLIILDINMPGLDGRDTLARIKQSENLNHLPVVLFTTSSSEKDKSFAQKWGADFITKPLVYSELENLARRFLHICSSEVSAHA